MDKFWEDTMNCLLGVVLYHGMLPDDESWCKQYEHEINNIINDIKEFHKANKEAGFEVSNSEMARFLVYQEFVHISNEHFVKKCAVDEDQLIMISAKINDELN